VNRFFLLFFFFVSSLLAKKLLTCNTVQLVSLPSTYKQTLLQKRYPQDCKVMQIGTVATVRCGCFPRIAGAKQRFEQLKKRYKHASLASTYTYRFAKKELKMSNTKRGYKKKISNNESELRLILQIFLYKGDLESAYKVAKFGYKHYPNSYYWNQKMANICQWTNRTAQAIKHMRKMYELRYNPRLENKLIKYGLTYFQYESIEPLVLNKARKYPTKANIDNLVNVYTKIGLPEKVLNILESEYRRTKNSLLLTKGLELALETGDLQRAKKYVSIISCKKPYTKVDAALIAKYYYINREINKALTSLLDAKNRDTIEDINDSKELDYFRITSDIAWYLQKNRVAAEASKKLMDVHRARQVDYERISLVYPAIDNNVAIEAVERGYKKYKLSYIFFSYANNAIAKKRFQELVKLLDSIDEKRSPLVKKPLYWIIKSKVYRYYKKYDKEELALKKALALSPDNVEIRISLLWHFMDINDFKNIKLMLLDIEDSAPLSESLYFPLASAYFYLHDINRASFYLDEMHLNQDPIIHTLRYKFLLAYVEQMQNKEGTFKMLMHEITDRLKEKMKKIPALKKDDATLSNYFRAAMYTLNPDKFEKKLKKAKLYLKKKNYDEIAYSWAVYNKAYEKSHKIYNKTKKKELWLLFSDALIFEHHTKIENLLDQYLQMLSPGDAVGALVNDGQIARAQSENFKLLSHNDANQNAYIQQIDLSKKRTDMLDVKFSKQLQRPLSQNYFQCKNRSYIGDNWYIMQGYNIYKNSTTDKKLLQNLPTSIYKAELGVKKEFQKGGYIQTYIAYNHKMRNYFSFWLDGEYRENAYVTYGTKIGKNMQADEGTKLSLGGYKDLLSSHLQYMILNSTSIQLEYEKSIYHSQDNIYVGEGDYFTTTISQQIRNGYPDIFVGIFYNSGAYNERVELHGVIDKLQKQNYKILPNNFYNLGINFSYGLANRSIYTRVWRPYFSLSPAYNSAINNYTYSFEAGYGGKVWHQDHMSIGASYSDSLKGINGKIFEIYLNYQFLYTANKEF